MAYISLATCTKFSSCPVVLCTDYSGSRDSLIDRSQDRRARGADQVNLLLQLFSSPSPPNTSFLCSDLSLSGPCLGCGSVEACLPEGSRVWAVPNVHRCASEPAPDTQESVQPSVKPPGFMCSAFGLWLAFSSFSCPQPSRIPGSVASCVVHMALSLESLRREDHEGVSMMHRPRRRQAHGECAHEHVHQG